MFNDHLGSGSVITDANGAIVETASFDAFGKRRNANSWQGYTNPFSQLPNLAALLNITQKGYTGHIQVDHASIIHMGGRIYDPDLGRFIQADPIVQDPRDAQSLNRYTYVFNNPLSYTDPTGYDCHNLVKQQCHSAIEQQKEDAAKAAQTQGSSKTEDVSKGNQSANLQNSAKVASGQDTNKSGTTREEARELRKLEHKAQRGGRDLDQYQQAMTSTALRKQINSEISAAYKQHGLNAIFAGEHAEELAAVAWSNAINPISMKYNIEIGARLFSDSGLQIAYIGSAVTNYNPSGILVDTLWDSNIAGGVIGSPKWSAFIHTHSRSTPGADEFSGTSFTSTNRGLGGDLPLAAFWGRNSYIATPEGNLHKFTYSNWVDGTPLGNPATISTVSRAINKWGQ